jgi:hypothetical protein
MGRGTVLTEAEVAADAARRSEAEATADSNVQTLPTRGFHCAQSCLLIAIAIAIIIFAIGCFGLWAIADYLMIEVFNLPYRAPLTGMIHPGFFQTLSLLLRFL